MLLKDFDVRPGSTIYIQDKGTQVSYRLVSPITLHNSVVTNLDKLRTSDHILILLL